MPVRLTIQGRNDVLKASFKIKEHGSPKAIRKELNKALKEAAAPGVESVKAAALALPAKSNRQVLRRRIAAATSAQVRSTGKEPSVKVRISRARMKDKAPVPQLMDRGPFRHPVFSREKWAPQEGHLHWFETAVERTTPIVRERIQAAADRITKSI